MKCLPSHTVIHVQDVLQQIQKDKGICYLLNTVEYSSQLHVLIFYGKQEKFCTMSTSLLHTTTDKTPQAI